MKLNATPAVWGELATTANVAAVPAVTLTAALVSAERDGEPDDQVAVMVREPAVLSVTLNWCVPATSAAGDGTVAAGSLDAIATAGLAAVTTFQ